MLLAGCSGSPARTVSPLRYDGIYSVKTSTETCYLRFYTDGTVVDSCSTDPPEVMLSLNRNWRDVSRGRFQLNGQHIIFSTNNPAGIVDYSGAAAYDRLFLHYHSRINNREGTSTFTFTELPTKTKRPNKSLEPTAGRRDAHI
jgi:hypothetical protein